MPSMERQNEDMLIAAMREYEFALLAVVQAQYRQAFTALRLCFELLLSAVQLSANELELRTWLRGDRDLNWSALADADTGLFSKKFARAFFEELEEQSAHYRAMAGAVYRECSGTSTETHTLSGTCRTGLHSTRRCFGNGTARPRPFVLSRCLLCASGTCASSMLLDCTH